MSPFWLRFIPLALLLIGALLSGCSVKFAYNNLDRLARWSVNDYVNMDDAQRAYFDAAVADLLHWHRTQHLPRYAAFLEGVETSLSDGTDAQELQSIVNVILDWADEIEAQGMPIAVELLASLSDEQVVSLARRLSERNAEIAEPEAGVALEAAQANWASEFADRFTRFSGRLTAEQAAYLESQSVRYIPELELWSEYRRRWQADLFKLLEQRHDLDAFGPGLRRLAAQRERYYGEELTAIYESNIALNRDVSVWLINELTPRQRDRFFRRLADVAIDLRELSAAAPEDPPAFDACLIAC